MPTETEKVYLRAARKPKRSITPQLSHSSIEDGAVNEYDAAGQLSSTTGKQFDGEHGSVSLTGPTPPTPSTPIITPRIGGLNVRWDGLFVDAFGVPDATIIAPTLFSRVEVHVSTKPDFTAEYQDTLLGVIETPRGTDVPVTLPSGTYYIRLRTRTMSGKPSTATPPVNAEVKIDAAGSNSLTLYDPVTKVATFTANGDTGEVLLQNVSADGATTSVTGQGIRTYASDGSLATQLGNFGEDYLGISDGTETVAAITALGEILGKGLTIDADPEFLGTPLLGGFANHESVSVGDPAGTLDRLGWALVVNAEKNIRAETVSNGEKEILEFEFAEVVGRAYRVTVEPLGVYVDDGSYCYINLRYEVGGGRPTMDSTIFRRIPVRPQGTTGMFTLGGTWVHQPGLGGVNRTARILVTLVSDGGRSTVFDSQDGGYLRCYVEDVGMRVENTAVLRSGTRAIGDTSPAPQPTEPTKKNYTKKYIAQGVQAYINSGAKYLLAGADNRLYQGNSGYNTQNGSSTGNLRSMATFADWTGDLSGAEITGVEIYLYFPYWWSSAGGTAEIGLHGYDVIQSTFTGNSNHILDRHFDKPEGRWVDVPSQYWNGFKTGEWKGIWLGPGNYRTNHGYARDGAAVRFHYRK